MKKYLAVLIACTALPVSAAEETIDCENAFSTLEMNRCAGIDLEQAEQTMQHYFEASLKHHNGDPVLVDAIKTAQTQWEQYRTAHCDSVYTQWRDGTIRGVLSISCKTELTEKRTHELWENFLTYMDSTPAVLPEPKL